MVANRSVSEIEEHENWIVHLSSALVSTKHMLFISLSWFHVMETLTISSSLYSMEVEDIWFVWFVLLISGFKSRKILFFSFSFMLEQRRLSMWWWKNNKYTYMSLSQYVACIQIGYFSETSDQINSKTMTTNVFTMIVETLQSWFLFLSLWKLFTMKRKTVRLYHETNLYLLVILLFCGNFAGT